MGVYDIDGNPLYESSSLFAGKKLLATGDSITENNSTNNNKSWCEYLPELLGATVYNDGKSGTGLAKSFQSNPCILRRVETLWDNTYPVPDIVLIMGNMNDGTGANGTTQKLDDLGVSGWQSTGVLAVGAPSDSIETQSVYGCTRRFLQDVVAKYPLAKIGWILSTPRTTSVSAWTGKELSYGHGWFEDYITAIKYWCEQYNVPVLDLYHLSQFHAMNGTNASTYYSDATIHPNTSGIKKNMAGPIVKWIEQYFCDIP